MNCDDVSGALIEKSNGGSLQAEAREHLNGCQSCQEFARMLDEPVPVDPPSPAILAGIQQRIARDLRPVKPLAPAVYFFAAVVVVFLSVVTLGVFRYGMAGVMNPLQSGVILIALAAGAALLAHSLVRQMTPGSKQRVSPGVLSVVILAALALAIVILFSVREETHFWTGCRACIRIGLPVAILTAAPVWLILGRGAFLAPVWAGAASGLFAGLAGTAMLEIHCPNLDAQHILVAHLGVAAICAVAGLILGSAGEIGSSKG